MKLSKYVRVISNGCDTILFNTINSCIVSFDFSFDRLDENILDKISQAEALYLKENSFFIDESTALELFNTTEPTTSLTVTLSLTECCNLRCKYCYENNLDERYTMSIENIDKVVLFIQKIVNSDKHIRTVYMDLIGGEPLLAVDNIEYFINRMKEIDVRQYYLLETNGTLFSKRVRDIFSNFNTTVNIAITLPEDHNAMRPFAGEMPTYDLIVQNLLESQSFFAADEHRLVLRYNARKENIAEFERFYDTMKQRIPYEFQIEIAPVIDYSYNSEVNSLSKEEFSDWFLAKYFLITDDPYSTESFLLHSRRRTGCTAFNSYNIKIHADGSLALCNAWVPENRRGSIDMLLSGEKKEDIFAHLYKDRELDSECRRCENIFLCGGKTFCRGTHQCHFVDFDIDTYIRAYVNGGST